MIISTLPCADPKCNDKMRLVFQNERFIGYRCLLKPNSHNFRYSIKKDIWEKILIKTKPIICFKESPYDFVKEEINIENF